MQKCFLIGIVLSGFVFAQAQSNKRLDSLLHLLPSSQGTARVDCNIAIGLHYLFAEKQDSAVYYTDNAITEARYLQYRHGLAMAFCSKAQIVKHFEDDFVASETFAKQALHWYAQTSTKAGLDTLYNALIYALLAQSKFDEAIGFAEKKYEYAKQTGNRTSMLESLGWMFSLYRQSGNYEKSFWYAQQRYDFASRSNNKFWISNALYGMAQLYALIEDYPNALLYFRRVLQLDDDDTRNDRIATDNDIWFKMEFTEVFSHLGQFDSAWHYYSLYKPARNKTVYLRVYWVSTGECYLLQGEYRQALQNFQLGLTEHRKLNDRNEVMRTLLDIGKTYLALNNNVEALRYGREGLELALQTKSKQYIRDGYQILSTVYDRLHQADSANHYFRQYIAMKDAMLNDQTKAKFAAYNYNQKIAFLRQEREMQQAKLAETSFHRNVLIAGIVGVLLLSVIVLRIFSLKRKQEKQQLQHALEVQRLESEKTRAELQHQASELEMQALRAQMNPHFIFNCLNAINHFILNHEAETASDYLTKFSRLIRMVLSLSQKTEVSLQEELDCLSLYIQLEQLRFQQHFQYTILGADAIDTESIYIPTMLLQPFVENAIWHGLMHKAGAGALTIEVALHDSALCCTITDNGIGRSEAAALKSKSAAHKKSMGMQITANRLQLLNDVTDNNLALKVIDLKKANGDSAGTKVVITIPVNVFQNPIPDPV